MIRNDVKEKTSLENDIKLAKFRELANPKQIRTRKNEKLQEQRRKEISSILKKVERFETT